MVWRTILYSASILVFAGCQQGSSTKSKNETSARSDSPGTISEEVNEESQGCGSLWLTTSSKMLPAFPDTHATYVSSIFFLKKETSVKLEGEFPHSRYMSLTVYDQSRNPITSLQDFQIDPKKGSINPFTGGTDRNATNRHFEVTITTEDTENKNAIKLPKKDRQLVSMLYRVYVPDRGKDKFGGVKLPKITLLNAANEPEGCPESPLINRESLQEELPSLGNLEDMILTPFPKPDPIEKIIAFFREAGEGQFANGEASYLLSTLDSNEINLIRLRAASFPDTYNGATMFDGATDLRYWSLCSAGISTLTTGGCLADYELSKNQDGNFVYLVIAPPKMKEDIEKLDYPFVKPAIGPVTMLVVRHTLPAEGYLGDITNVESFEGDARDAPIDYAAHNYIGEMAPVGVVCDDFESLASGQCLSRLNEIK